MSWPGLRTKGSNRAVLSVDLRACDSATSLYRVAVEEDMTTTPTRNPGFSRKIFQATREKSTEEKKHSSSRQDSNRPISRSRTPSSLIQLLGVEKMSWTGPYPKPPHARLTGPLRSGTTRATRGSEMRPSIRAANYCSYPYLCSRRGVECAQKEVSPRGSLVFSSCGVWKAAKTGRRLVGRR